MMRLFTYITGGPLFPPIAFGTYFDPVLIDLNVVPGTNMQIQPLRDGTEILMFDPQLQFENRGTLLVSATHVDLKSTVQYLGSDVYLGSVLYYHYKNHLPIIVHTQSTQSTHAKAYFVYLTAPFDKVLEAAATEDVTVQLYLTRMTSKKVLTFPVYIYRNGRFTDYDDPETDVWEDRN